MPKQLGSIARLQVPLQALFILLCLGLAVEASGGAPPSFAEFVRQSETILSGTVDRAWVEMDRRVHEPVVRVSLKRIRVVKGAEVDRSWITFWPSEADSGSTREEVSRRFRKGGRYVLLLPESLDEEKRDYVPITALNGGVFPVLNDPPRQRLVVHDSACRPVARVGRDRLVLIDKLPGASRGVARRSSASGGAISTGPRIEVLPAAEDPGTRVSEEEFLRAVREILAARGTGSARSARGLDPPLPRAAP